MIFENEKIYKTLKKIWQYVIPALMFLWEGIYRIWNIPYGSAIFATLVVVWGAFAIFLGISKYKYNNAQIDAINVDLSDEGEVEE